MLFKVINFYFCASRWVLVINGHKCFWVKNVHKCFLVKNVHDFF